MFAHSRVPSIPPPSTPARTHSTPARTRSTPACTRLTPMRTCSTPTRTPLIPPPSPPSHTRSTPAHTPSTTQTHTRRPDASHPRASTWGNTWMGAVAGEGSQMQRAGVQMRRAGGVGVDGALKQSRVA
ncbi:hypothetical protein BJV77DRAFT_240779 [Russula vinacea]|nr:hypothetical protein BJV77DRAFT_240779 [Russula vinacea]